MKIIAHRGARGLAPENTISAIKEGMRHHPDMVEIDIRVTKDGVCVLHHDPTLEDGTTIADATFQELQARKADLATLDEAIQTVNRKVPMYIEVKPRVPTGQIVKLLRSYLDKGWQPEDLWLASFSHKTLRKLRQGLPELPVIVIEHFSGLRATWRARRLGTKFIVINHRVLYGAFIRMMKRRGWKLGTYTVNDVAKAKRWKQSGLYALVTDYPDRFDGKSK